jgi:class 3 adenylate cyclase
MLGKVVALATRLQSQQGESLTAREMEAIGAEVGLDPTFIRQALAQVVPEQSQATPTEARKKEFWSVVAVSGAAALWSLLAWIFGSDSGLFPTSRFFFTLIAPWPLAVALGALAGNKRAGTAAGVTLLIGLAPSFVYGVLPPGDVGRRDGQGILPWILLTAPLAGWLGSWGSSIRDYYFPPPSVKPRSVSRSSLINLLFVLQNELEAQKQHRSFLSVDVVGSSEMKRSASALAVEHSFTTYRHWVEALVYSCGGELQSAAGDGMMCVFPSDDQAVCAARRLQEGLPSFNAHQNRLPMPFRIRCGVSAGEVPMEEGMLLGHLQSSVIDRAAALQKRAEPGGILVSGEVTGAALKELGSLAPLPESVAGEPAFSWRSGER